MKEIPDQETKRDEAEIPEGENSRDKKSDERPRHEGVSVENMAKSALDVIDAEIVEGLARTDQGIPRPDSIGMSESDFDAVKARSGFSARLEGNTEDLGRIRKETKDELDRLIAESGGLEATGESGLHAHTHDVESAQDSLMWSEMFPDSLLSAEQADSIFKDGMEVLKQELEKIFEKRNSALSRGIEYSMPISFGDDFTEPQLKGLLDSFSKGDLESHVRSCLKEERMRINGFTESSREKLLTAYEALRAYLADAGATGIPEEPTKNLWVGKYASLILSGGTIGRVFNNGGGQYLPDVDATALYVPDKELESGKASDFLVELYTHEQTHAVSPSYESGGHLMNPVTSRKLKSGFDRAYNPGEPFFTELNEGTTQLITEQALNRAGIPCGDELPLENREGAKVYEPYVEEVRNLIRFLAEQRSEKADIEGETKKHIQRYMRPGGLGELKRDLVEVAGPEFSSLMRLLPFTQWTEFLRIAEERKRGESETEKILWIQKNENTLESMHWDDPNGRIERIRQAYPFVRFGKRVIRYDPDRGTRAMVWEEQDFTSRDTG